MQRIKRHLQLTLQLHNTTIKLLDAIAGDDNRLCKRHGRLKRPCKTTILTLSMRPQLKTAPEQAVVLSDKKRVEESRTRPSD